MLKKEFKRKDVNRARNLIMGKLVHLQVHKLVTVKKQKNIKKVMFGQKEEKHGLLKMALNKQYLN